MKPLVFRTPRGRLCWLERGLLWAWSDVLWRWCRVPALAAARVGGAVLTADAVVELVAERGTPFAPRVEAGAWLPCCQCGDLCGERRTHLGVRAFCSPRCAETFIRATPPIDSESQRN